MVDLLGKPMIFCLFPVHFGEKFVASHPCEARFNAPGGLVISTDPRRVQGSRHFLAQESRENGRADKSMGGGLNVFIFSIWNDTWGNFSSLLICFRWVEATKTMWFCCLLGFANVYWNPVAVSILPASFFLVLLVAWRSTTRQTSSNKCLSVEFLDVFARWLEVLHGHLVTPCCHSFVPQRLTTNT